MPFIRLTELAKKAKLPRSTVKWYVEQGLVKISKRTSGGFKLFDEAKAVKRLKEIRKAVEECQQLFKKLKR